MRVTLRNILPLALLVSSSALAQQPNARVRDLNREAIEAYHQLDIERAEALLTEAQGECDRTSCTPADRARTLANFGIVAYGGAGDAARASTLFRQAIEADSTITLDPLLRTPDIDLLFQRARAEASTSNTGGAGGVNLRHTPPREQLAHTALPVYVAVPNDISVARMDLRYLGNGMRRYATLPMQPMVDGFGVELACEHVFEPSISYYFVAYDGAGRTIRTIGTEQDPFRVPIVTSRTEAAPALPGRTPPEPCNFDECPPNVDCSGRTSGGTGTSTGTTTGTTTTPASEEEEDDDGPTMRYYLDLGPALTMARGRDDMRAADLPGGVGPEYDSYIQGGQPGCSLPSSQYCMRVTENGTAFAWGIHLGLGMWFTDRVGASLFARISPQSGGGTLSRALVGARFQYRILVPRPEGLFLTAHLGASVGQIQIRAKQELTPGATSIERPWARTGLGGIQLGGTVGYQFSPSLGVFFTPEAYMLFPDTGIGGNFTAGMNFSFGEVGGESAPETPDAPPPPRPRPGDRDRDTILDATDGCKMEPEDMDGFEDTNGCPDPDNDGDTVLDAQDRCPMERGVPTNQGCPEPDRDGDTVADRFDNCPDEPGTVENRGCQVRQLVTIEGDHLEILDKIYFRTNSHVIDRRSNTLLDNIASVLNAHPEITMISIEGHTDARGNAARNRTLSQRRANSVRVYLVRRGVTPTRLRSTGYGPDRPVFPNATSEAEHEANRRVEFQIQSGT